MTATAAAEVLRIPASHVDLLDRAIVGVFTTLAADGQPHSSLVWVDQDGACARVNTTLERRHGRNLVANPKVSLLVVDPDDTTRFIQIRGDAELLTQQAIPHADELARKYTPHPAFYGFVYPESRRALDHGVICRIHPVRITLDAIHS